MKKATYSNMGYHELNETPARVLEGHLPYPGQFINKDPHAQRTPLLTANEVRIIAREMKVFFYSLAFVFVGIPLLVTGLPKVVGSASRTVARQMDGEGSSQSGGSAGGGVNGGAEWRGRAASNEEVVCRTMGQLWDGKECRFGGVSTPEQQKHLVDLYHQQLGY